MEGRAPLLELEREHAARGRAELAKLGLGSDDWYVALHVREAGYLGEGPRSHRLHRNADVHTYLPAAREIVARGGWVIRMGDPTMTRLPAEERVVDYAHSPVRSDWMDVFLAASCRFFLGSSSGLFVVAWSFGRQCVLANWDSLASRPWSRQDLYIPKLWWLDADDRPLRLDELRRPPFSDGRFAETVWTQSLRDVGVRLVDSTPEEIRELAKEALGDATVGDEQVQNLRLRFDAAIGRYPLGAGARVGAAFLQRHAAALLGDPPG
jgi:putative glycosyltransferase (TIGR04372 family)